MSAEHTDADVRPFRVVFVCYANLCRSPLAEAIFTRLVESRGLSSRFEADSAGIAARQGLPPHHLGRQVAEARGLELQGCSRALSADDFIEADELVLMNSFVMREIRRLNIGHGGSARLRFLPGQREVPDPVSGGSEGFEYVADLLEVACERYLDRLLAGFYR